MFHIGWLVLCYLVWGLSALYVCMTIHIWLMTLRTLGLSALRHCPRMLRLSFRASLIRELSVAILLPLIVIPLLRAYGIGGEYIAALPLNALLLMALSGFTLCLVPPTVVVFSSSTDRQLRWALALKKFTGGRRVISLLDTGYMVVKPSARDAWSIMSRRSASMLDVLRTSEKDNWQVGVKALIEIAPIVIVDTRVCTPALLFEASSVLTPEYSYKSIFLSEDDDACPVLEKLLDEGGIPADCLLSVVKEDELGPLLKSRVVSKATLPKIGSFALTPFMIGERFGRRGVKRQAKSPSMTATFQSSHPARGFRPEEKKSLSTLLTPFWRLMAKAVVVQLLLSVAWSLWIMLTLPQLIFSSRAGIVLASLVICSWASSALYFYLARSLKKVCIAGDSLFVSDSSKECEIYISQISRVSGPDWTTLRRITLHLHQPSAFGQKIVFAGKIFTAGMIARDLRRRLYKQAEGAGRANPAQAIS